MSAADRILARLAAHADEGFEYHEKLKARPRAEVTGAELAYAEGWRHGTATAHTLATVEALKAETKPEAALTLAQHLERDHERHATCGACGKVHEGRCLESEG